MRNFIIASEYTAAKIDALTAGQLCVYDLSGDVPDESKVPTKAGLLVLGSVEGNRVLPIYNNKLSYVESNYVAATTFSQTVKVISQEAVGDYTLIVVKKGVGFNERNKWTANVHVNVASETAAKIAEKLTTVINGNSASSGVKAEVSDDTITVTALEAGVDYKLVLADYLTESELGEVTAATAGQNCTKHIKDLHAKAAADMGFNDTQQFTELLYKGYEIDPHSGTPTTDYGFDVLTIKFAEPRETRTVDQDIKQIIQVAFPRLAENTVNPGMTTLVGKFKEMLGETVAEDEDETPAAE